jgi:transposase
MLKVFNFQYFHMQNILTDDQYEILEALLPRNTNKKKAGRPSSLPDRVALEGMLYVLSTGCQWRKLPKEYGRWHTVYTRYVRWVSSGVF